jgi:tRNA-methyltransferase O
MEPPMPPANRPPLDRIELRPIGHVRTAYRRFDYAHLICFLAQIWRADDGGTRPFTGDRLRPVPFLLQDTGERVGVFATRSPVRPNYLALSLVRVVAVRGSVVDFSGVDLLDHVRGGWYQRHAAAANPLVRPGREGLLAAGIDPPREDP